MSILAETHDIARETSAMRASSHPDHTPPTRAVRPGLGHAQVLAGAALFGVNAGVSKVVLTSGVQPARLTALRCTGAALGLLLILAATSRHRLRVPWRELPALAVLGLTGAALIQWLYFVAIDRLPVGIALLLEFTGPLLVAVYARTVQREAVHRQVWLALGLALGGLALVGQVWDGGGLDPLGVLAGFGAAVCLAVFYLLGKSTVERRDPVGMTFWMLAFAALFWAVAQPWWSFDSATLTARTSLLGAFDGVQVPVWLALSWVVALGTLAPYALQIAALRHLPPTTSGVVGMAEPVLAAAVAWAWLGQVLDGVQVVGGALVLVGVGLAQLAQTRAARSAGAARSARSTDLAGVAQAADLAGVAHSADLAGAAPKLPEPTGPAEPAAATGSTGSAEPVAHTGVPAPVSPAA